MLPAPRRRQGSNIEIQLFRNLPKPLRRSNRLLVHKARRHRLLALPTRSEIIRKLSSLSACVPKVIVPMQISLTTIPLVPSRRFSIPKKSLMPALEASAILKTLAKIQPFSTKWTTPVSCANRCDQGQLPFATGLLKYELLFMKGSAHFHPTTISNDPLSRQKRPRICQRRSPDPPRSGHRTPIRHRTHQSTSSSRLRSRPR